MRKANPHQKFWGKRDTIFFKTVPNMMIKIYLCSLCPKKIVIRNSAFFYLAYADFHSIYTWCSYIWS